MGGRLSVGSSFMSPLSKAGRIGEVTQRLRQAIQLGLLADGEQLPSESELAAQLGVSHMTLREALAVLREQGLVETRRGRVGGTFVRRPANPSVRAVRARLRSMSASQVRDLGDAHLAVTGACAKLAAERASPSNVRRLQSLAAQVAKASGIGAKIRADSRFHIELAIATQSERLSRLAIDIQGDCAELLWLPSDDEVDAQALAHEHWMISEAIGAEDGETARRLAEAHAMDDVRRLVGNHLACAGR